MSICQAAEETKVESAGAPGNESEITPEMVIAGATELASYNYEEGNESEVVTAIYRAMTAAMHRRQ